MAHKHHHLITKGNKRGRENEESIALQLVKELMSKEVTLNLENPLPLDLLESEELQNEQFPLNLDDPLNPLELVRYMKE